jgi:hypothetical protein
MLDFDMTGKTSRGLVNARPVLTAASGGGGLGEAAVGLTIANPEKTMGGGLGDGVISAAIWDGSKSIILPLQNIWLLRWSPIILPQLTQSRSNSASENLFILNFGFQLMESRGCEESDRRETKRL